MNALVQPHGRALWRACMSTTNRLDAVLTAAPHEGTYQRATTSFATTAVTQLCTSKQMSTSASVSDTEVQKFSALSESWWNPAKNPLISMNVIRTQFIRDAVSRHLPRSTNAGALPLEGLAALDIGCGGGLLSESLARLGAVTRGIDPSQALISAAQQHAATRLSTQAARRLEYTGGITVEEFASTRNRSESLFDVVCCLEVIEHVPNPMSVLRTATDLLKPDGLLFVSTINRTAKSFALTIVGAEYILRYLPIGTHQWESYKSPQEVQQLLHSVADVQAIEAAGMVLTPSSLPALLTRNVWNWELDPTDTDVNWIACYQKQSS